MKKSLKLRAILIMFGMCTALISSAQAKATATSPPLKNLINFTPLESNASIGVQVERNNPGNVVVIIMDEYGNVLLKQVLSHCRDAAKNYILNKLDNGDYTIEVTSNKKEMDKDIRVYDGQCRIL